MRAPAHQAHGDPKDIPFRARSMAGRAPGVLHVRAVPKVILVGSFWESRCSLVFAVGLFGLFGLVLFGG